MNNNYPPRSLQFIQRLAEEVIIGDGAMGTLLYSRGVPLETNFEYLNLLRPELVRQVHEDYLRAGAQLLETNTFGASSTRLAAVGLEKKTRAINIAGARLAREAAGPERFVAGSVGPLTLPRGELREFAPGEKEAVLHEQMEALAEGGADLFLLETFASLDDLELTAKVATGLGLPVVAQMAYLEEGRTRDGVAAEEVARRLSLAGVAVLGANCGSGPRDLLKVLARLAAASDLPLSAFANSGFPQYVDGRFIYLATPEYFAGMGREMVQAGAALVGGCCGTTPEHIRALAEAVVGLKPSRPPRPTAASAPPPAKPVVSVPKRTFLDAWGERPVITVELDPPRGLDCSKVLAAAHALAAAGVDAISLAENPLARIRLGNLALARSIQEEAGVEVIAHVTCRARHPG
jgi:methionine synthase I (cobalamin-dependent)